MNEIEATQMEQIKKVAEVMADCIQSGHLVHTFGCGHANLPIEEMYPHRRIPSSLRAPFDILHPHRRRDGYQPVPVA